MSRRRPECIGSDRVLETRWITVLRNKYRLDGSTAAIDYYVTDTAEIALVVPITRTGSYVMVEQWKLPIARRSLEFPAGAVAKGTALANARRELLEETGFAGGKWRKLGIVFPDTGRSRNAVHVFAARGVTRVREPALDPGEAACGLRTVEVSRTQLRDLIRAGRVLSAGTLAALALLAVR